MIFIESNVSCSTIDHLLVHFNKEGQGTAYVNELQQVGKIKANKSVKQGDPLYDDSVTYEELRFDDLEIPPDHGVLVVFSRGWRKGLFLILSLYFLTVKIVLIACGKC